MTTPRPYVAATAAAVLGALFFVPSATAETTTPARATTASAEATDTAATTGVSSDDLRLADTGSVNTAPYLIGGTGFLVVGAALVLSSTRRARADG